MRSHDQIQQQPDRGLPLPRELRIAPFGFAISMASVVAGALTQLPNYISGGIEQVVGSPSLIESGVATTLGVLGGIALAAKQLARARTLERVLDERGYDDRFLNLYTKEWCARQTARVICEETGVLPQFENLCEREKLNSDLTWVPHI